jgi:hypothetical protein
MKGSSGYQSVMRLSKSPMYHIGEIISSWLDVTYACYLVQIDPVTQSDFYATSVRDVLIREKPGHQWFPGLTKLVEYCILEKSTIGRGGGKRDKPRYKLADRSGVALALHELGYPISL